MAAIPQCPLCFTPMVVLETGPCMDCGPVRAVNREGSPPAHPAPAAVYRYQELGEVTLCQPCLLDLGSYRSGFWGLPSGKRLDMSSMNYVRPHKGTAITKGHVCLQCEMGLPWIEFVLQVRAAASKESLP